MFKEEIQHKVVITVISKDNYCKNISTPNKIISLRSPVDYRAPVATKRLIEY